ncbi:MAG TPA: Dabb family protein [Planctomycetota bacterium]|nr:Dabb family protein [Planctomycetota bacterium]
MNKIALFLCALVLCVSASAVNAADAPAGKTKLQHIVALKFKEGASADEIKKITDAFAALKGKIPEVAAYAGGPNVSKEGKDKGFGHCAILTFKSQKDLEAYIVHAEHQAFVKMLGGIVVDAFVYDFWE